MNYCKDGKMLKDNKTALGAHHFEKRDNSWFDKTNT